MRAKLQGATPKEQKKIAAEKARLAPIMGAVHGQNINTPHRAARVRVYYVEGENFFFTVSGNCKTEFPGKFIKSCSIQRALRLGLKWEPKDERDERERSREITMETQALYDEEGGTRRLKKEVPIE